MDGVDKLLVTLGDRPLLAHAIGALAAGGAVDAIVVVTTAERRAALLAGDWLPAGRRVVLVHDGARPMVSHALIADVIAAVGRYGAAIPALPVAETLKRVADDRIAATVDRSDLVTAQTPQGARRHLLREALASTTASAGTWTDEAALLEACRIAVHVVPGDPANLKVTVPTDLERAASLLTGPVSRRTGMGRDGHPFGPGEPLRLGGIDITGVPRLH